jgi:hypothetical protein
VFHVRVAKQLEWSLSSAPSTSSVLDILKKYNDQAITPSTLFVVDSSLHFAQDISMTSLFVSPHGFAIVNITALGSSPALINGGTTENSPCVDILSVVRSATSFLVQGMYNKEQISELPSYDQPATNVHLVLIVLCFYDGDSSSDYARQIDSCKRNDISSDSLDTLAKLSLHDHFTVTNHKIYIPIDLSATNHSSLASSSELLQAFFSSILFSSETRSSNDVPERMLFSSGEFIKSLKNSAWLRELELHKILQLGSISKSFSKTALVPVFDIRIHSPHPIAISARNMDDRFSSRLGSGSVAVENFRSNVLPDGTRAILIVRSFENDKYLLSPTFVNFIQRHHCFASLKFDNKLILKVVGYEITMAVMHAAWDLVPASSEHILPATVGACQVIDDFLYPQEHFNSIAAATHRHVAISYASYTLARFHRLLRKSETHENNYNDNSQIFGNVMSLNFSSDRTKALSSAIRSTKCMDSESSDIFRKYEGYISQYVSVMDLAAKDFSHLLYDSYFDNLFRATQITYDLNDIIWDCIRSQSHSLGYISVVPTIIIPTTKRLYWTGSKLWSVIFGIFVGLVVCKYLFVLVGVKTVEKVRFRSKK